jgi:subtilisin-like proprotein convertase family protein
MITDYFGPGGLGYVPGTSGHLTDWGGNAERLNADMNSGAFIVQHRDHGSWTGWDEPDYHIEDMAGLTNTDLTFVFSVNCLTGIYNWSNECFTEALHRHEHGALGLVAASESSYSFVNDTFVFGMYDEMWPEFDPGYPAAGRFNESVGELRPAFASASGKHYLAASSWPSNPTEKKVTYNLFHMHGDAFTRLYSEVPQSLTVAHEAALPVGAATFNITADAGAIVALTIDGEIVGVAEATGAPMDMTVTPPTAPGTAKLTITKANYYRYVEEVPVIFPGTHTIVPATVPVTVATDVTVTVWDSESHPKPDVVVTISGRGVAAVSDTTDANGEAVIAVMAQYGEVLTVVGRTIGEPYDCLNDVLPVTGALDFTTVDVEASVASIGLYGALAPDYEGLVEANVSHAGFYLMIGGCGVTDQVFSGGGTTASLLATPTSTGIISAAVCKEGYNVYLEDIDVQVVYGQLAGSVSDELTAPIVGAVIKGYPAGSDTTGATPLFQDVSDGAGGYAIEGDLDISYYDVYAWKFGYLPVYEETFVQCGANTVDFYLDSAPPSGVMSGTVTELGTGTPLEATVKVYRSDNMELYAETTSDPGTGYYEVTLPYFNYHVNVHAYHHIPENRGISVSTPAMTEDFVLDVTLADVLVISDVAAARGEASQVDEAGSAIDIWSGGSNDGRSASQISTDLIALGYDVTEETATSSDPGTWLTNYDFILWASGDNAEPVADWAYRSALMGYVAGGGKLLIEGGELAYDAVMSPGYPTFAANVLHSYAWSGHSCGSLTVYDPAHPVTSFPNTIGTIVFTFSNDADQDASVPTGDASGVCSWTSYPSAASIIVYDDNAIPASGQIVFFQFNYLAAGAGIIDLLENAVTYLTAQEVTPEGSISGAVTLEGQTDHSGVTVVGNPGGASVVTGVTGGYVLEGLYDGTYTVTATKPDWSTGVVEGVVVSGGMPVTGVDMTLSPVTTIEHCNSPALAIPDNTPAGVYDTITFAEDADIMDVEVHIDITHTYIEDLIVEVTSPEGTTVRLHDRTGGSANSIIGWYDTDLTVDGPGALLDFVGESTLGEWTLWVSDNAGTDVGTVNEWCVQTIVGSPTGVDDEFGTPMGYVLRGVSPNPFNPVTTVSYGSPSDAHVHLAIYNVAGRLVRTLVDREVDPGYHSVVWDGRDNNGVEVGSGVYFCRMEAEGFDASVKMVLLK